MNLYLFMIEFYLNLFIFLINRIRFLKIKNNKIIIIKFFF